ncbi:MAG: nucleotide exchange factor GrpE [Dehalococcoidia bacterium]|nr:nucleotide exchange factor GrpE [Dehalococcoidia bacterium]MSQ16141.1 nucleotide exchange factor GrpE [Dehalococcoidia bacterium]
MTNNRQDIPQPERASEGQGASNPYANLGPAEQVAALCRDLDESRKQASQNLDLAQRAQAELINYRRRSDDDRMSQQKYSNGRLITKLLPLADEMDLAIAQAGEHSTGPWVEGIKLIRRKLGAFLDAEGVTRIEAAGVMFNPLEHEALDTHESNQHPSGYITKVVRTGYRLHDRVIQPAQVIVAR